MGIIYLKPVIRNITANPELSKSNAIKKVLEAVARARPIYCADAVVDAVHAALEDGIVSTDANTYNAHFTVKIEVAPNYDPTKLNESELDTFIYDICSELSIGTKVVGEITVTSVSHTKDLSVFEIQFWLTTPEVEEYW